MVLQSAGAISLTNIQTEFGGANPIGLNEYYLNGAYTTGSGAVGIPTSGQISLGSFYGKSKITSAWLPPAAQSTFSGSLPWYLGNTYYIWQNGARGTNLTRTGGATFDNLNFGYYGRPNFIDLNTLILQCMPGDTLSFLMSNTVTGPNYFTYASVLLNLGTGWFVAASPSGSGSINVSATYTIPASTSPGNYGILVYCDNNSAASVYYSSANFYSLHVVSSYAPTPAVQTTYSNFGLPWGLGSTYYEWHAGASGTNLTRTTGTTFNNLGADNYQNRPNFINYQNLILQAKPGDTVRFSFQTTALYGDTETASVLLNLGAGWFVVSSQRSAGSRTNTADYTIPASTAPGSYGIAFYCDYNTAASVSYSSANFYSLHIAN